MEEKRPAISVCIPVYNVEQLLPRCLDSVLSQSFQDFEIVCVNDASPDSSLDILHQYAARDSRIRIIDKSVNEGLMMARKTAYSTARGEYLFFLDSDDFIPETALEHLHSLAVKSGAQLSMGDLVKANANGNCARFYRHQNSVFDAKSLLKSTFHGSTPSLCGALYARELFDGHDFTGIKRQGFSEDRILLTEIILYTNPSVAISDTPVYFYWNNDLSITRKKTTQEALAEQFKAQYHCYNLVCEKCPELQHDNLHFLIRTISFYIESGVPAEAIVRADDRNAELIRFATMKKYVGARLAAHTWMSMRIPGYARATHAARHVIRRIQGKE